MKNYSQAQHESLFIDSFIIKEQKKRMKTLLKNKKGRKKFRESLAHTIKFNPAFIHKVPKNEQTTDNITKLLRKNNTIEECYLISEHTSLDGKIMKLEDAINAVVGSDIATIISCILGELAYYEGEGFNNRLILS